MSSRDHILATGTWLGDFEVIAPIDEGATAVVYKVSHGNTGKLYAAKVLKASLAEQPMVRERFRGEAEILTKLEHPNLVQVAELIDKGNVLACVMDFIEGSTLADYLKLHRGGLSEVLALSIFRQLTDAVAYAHSQGVVHRDLKPTNIMLTQKADGSLHAFVTDFGLAKILSRALKTVTGMQIGTIAYMAPEQIQDSSRVDGRADIYALGITLYECLTGALPYPYKSVYKIMEAHLNQKVPPVRRHRIDLSREWDQLIAQATHKDIERRFSSASAMLAALSTLARKLGLEDRTTRPITPAQADKLLSRPVVGVRATPSAAKIRAARQVSSSLFLNPPERMTSELESVSPPSFVEDDFFEDHEPTLRRDFDPASLEPPRHPTAILEKAPPSFVEDEPEDDEPTVDNAILTSEEDPLMPVYIDTDNRKSIQLEALLSGDVPIDATPTSAQAIQEKLESALDSQSIGALEALGAADTADLQMSDDLSQQLRQAAAQAKAQEPDRDARALTTPPESPVEPTPQPSAEESPEEPSREQRTEAALDLLDDDDASSRTGVFVIMALLAIALIGLVAGIALLVL